MRIFAETPRLLLRELVPDDAPGMFALDSDPAVLRYLHTKPQTAVAESAAVIELVRTQYAENGIGRWAVVLKNSGEFVGWCGMKLVRDTVNGHTDFYDLGYRLLQKHWAKGYGYEAARACLDYAFGPLGLSTLYGIAMTGNAGSRRILEKLGFQLVNFFEEHGEELVWYRLDRPVQ